MAFTRHSRELAEIIFFAPYWRMSDLVTTGIAKRQSVSLLSPEPHRAHFLKEMKIGRENLYINPPTFRASQRPPSRADRPIDRSSAMPRRLASACVQFAQRAGYNPK